MRKHYQGSGCSHDIHLVIWFHGAFAILCLVSVVILIGVAMIREKTVNEGTLIALLAQPMGVALNSLTNLVTQSKDQTPSGTPGNPVNTTVVNPPSDPIPVTPKPEAGE